MKNNPLALTLVLLSRLPALAKALLAWNASRGYLRYVLASLLFVSSISGALANDLVASITSPTAGQVVASISAGTPVQLAVNVRGTTGAVATAQFYEGGTLLGTGSLASGTATSGSFVFAWSNAPAGSHTITASITDDLGNVITTSPVAFTVNAPPVVSIVQPATGTHLTAPASISLVANATDSDGSITNFRFYRDGAYLFDANNNGNGNFSNTWNGVPAGTYTFTGVATDNNGAITASAPITVIVDANAVPTISITGPASGTTYTAPASIPFTASTTDSDGNVTNVRFYVNGGYLFDTNNNGGGNFSNTWNGVPAGTYTITAVATDNGGAISSPSTPITITVQPNNAPTISITGPASGSTYTAPASIPFTAHATDNDGNVTNVRFYVNGGYLFDTNNNGGGDFSNTWNNVGPGTYVLTAVATDNGGAISAPSSSITVTVTANNVPTISITGPNTGTSYTAPASIPLTAHATDTDGNVTNVRFYVNGGYLFDTNNNGSGNFSNTWNNVPAGTYTLTAVATDNAGAISVSSAPITVTVQPNSPPTISVTSPADGTTYAAPATIPLIATAADSDGNITNVRFYRNGAFLFDTNNNGNGTFGNTWNNVPGGTYTITAVAIDNAGAFISSSPITITVTSSTTDPNVPPVTSLTSPANGATFTAPASIPFASSASDSDGSISNIRYYANGALISDANWADGQGHWAFTWGNVPAGTYTLTTVATDNNGATTASAPITVTVNPNTAPTAAMTAPANGATYTAPASVQISGHASDSDGYISNARFYVNGAYLMDAGVDAQGNYTNTWSNIPAGTYSITTVVIDNGGRPSAASAPITFTVNANTAPTTAMTAPASGATYTAPASIQLSGHASDSDGSISSARFYVNGAYLMDAGVDGQGNYTNTWSNVPAGTYSFTTVVIDNGGMPSAPTAPITVTVNQGPPPAIRITSPANNTAYVTPASFTVTTIATSTSNNLDHVQFLLDGVSVGNEGVDGTTGQSSHGFGNVAVGTHVITAVAYDRSGQTSTSAPLTVRVYSTAPPSVAITSPANHLVFAEGANIPLQASAADTDGTVTQVQFFNGSTLIGNGTLSTGTTANGTWTTNAWTSVPKGTYTVTGQATDDSGGVVTSAQVIVTVDNGTVTSVALAGPSAGTTYTAPATIPLTAATSNAESVKFFNGSALIGEGFLASGTTSSGSWVTNAWTNVPAGTYSLTAVATDAYGNNITSAPVSFTVGASSSGTNTTMFFVTTDHLGTPRLVEDLMQQTVWRWDQGEPFGDSVPNGSSSSGSFVLNVRFPGQYFDQETNTSYNNARDYDPAAGKYIQSDPLGLGGSGPGTYSYALSDPLRMSDFLGLTVYRGPGNNYSDIPPGAGCQKAIWMGGYIVEWVSCEPPPPSPSKPKEPCPSDDSGPGSNGSGSTGSGSNGSGSTGSTGSSDSGSSGSRSPKVRVGTGYAGSGHFSLFGIFGCVASGSATVGIDDSADPSVAGSIYIGCGLVVGTPWGVSGSRVISVTTGDPVGWGSRVGGNLFGVQGNFFANDYGTATTASIPGGAGFGGSANTTYGYRSSFAIDPSFIRGHLP